MKYRPKISIVIPLHVVSDRFFSDLKKFSKLKYTNYEILIVVNEKLSIPKIANSRLLITGMKRSSPAEKRDFAVKYAKGDIMAYIDDDAYPDPNWLTNAVKDFADDPSLVAVGGSGLTPPDDSYLAKLGGFVYQSRFTSGKLRHRFTNEGYEKKFVEDWPAYNLFIKKSFLNEVGGWESAFYGGEDTYVCLKLISKGRILYDPDVIVYHHRRELFEPHLKQIHNVGVHRGYFFKVYPETSRSLIYLMPSLLTLGFWSMMLGSFFNTRVLVTFILFSSAAYTVACQSVSRGNTLRGSMISGLGVIATHMAYGFGFMRGLCTGKLEH